MREVVITGAGLLSPLGRGLEPTAAALRNGRGGIAPIGAFAADGFPVQVAGEIREPNLPTDGSRPEALARLALAEALADAGLSSSAADAPLDPRRAFSFALGKPTLDLMALYRARASWTETCDPETILAALPRLADERLRVDPAVVIARLAQAARAGGPRYGNYTACASGNDAIGLGKRLIERNQADVVVAGASDCQVHPLSLLEFELLAALSHEGPGRACRPFDRERTGFVVGEGAAVLVLEAATHAARRGAPVWARLAGYGSSLDCFGLTKCHPQGRGAAQAMRGALADAGLAPSAVHYLNAHGTGTVLNDRAEAAAIHQVWGDRARQLPVSSTKAMTGHLLTAASAVEAVIVLLALRDGLAPVNLNYRHFDPECDLDIIVDVARPGSYQTAMSNGFGFGGQNASLILSRAGAEPAAGWRPRVPIA